MSEEPRDRGSVWGGFGIGAGLNIVLTGAMAAMVSGVVLFGCGLVQLLWIVPAYFYFKGEGATETAKGILIAAAICFLLNASCWGIVMTMK
jgi:hypothetical protein